MTRDEVYRGVLAFLDQFIGRGAAADIHDLRSQLADDPQVRRLLDQQLSNDHPTDREAYDAMTGFFCAEAERRGQQSGYEGQPDLWELTRWMSWGWPDAEGNLRDTEDPAQWHDWLASVNLARQTSADG